MTQREDNPDDPADDDELESLIEHADHPFASESFGTTAEEQLAGESLDQRLSEERPEGRTWDEELEIEDLDEPDDEPELIGRATALHDPFAAPEESAMSIRDDAPGAVDHADDEYVKLYDESKDTD
jgi:hypothetical protein